MHDHRWLIVVGALAVAAIHVALFASVGLSAGVLAAAAVVVAVKLVVLRGIRRRGDDRGAR